MQSFTVVLDANVIVPMVAADVLLRLAERELYRPVWSQRILAEAQRTVLKLHPDVDEARVARRFAAMNAAFTDALVDGWEHLEDSIVLPDRDDRHVVACAITVGADAIVTNNVTDFPATAVAPFNLDIIRLDDFLLDLIDHRPEKVVDVIRDLARDAAHPPLTTSEVLKNLAAAGAPSAARELDVLI